jgi:hypothetical protein
MRASRPSLCRGEAVAVATVTRRQFTSGIVPRRRRGESGRTGRASPVVGLGKRRRGCEHATQMKFEGVRPETLLLLTEE